MDRAEYAVDCFTPVGYRLQQASPDAPPHHSRQAGLKAFKELLGIAGACQLTSMYQYYLLLRLFPG